MTVALSQAPAIKSKAAGFVTLLRLGLRELRGGLKGFYVFVACLALGVMVITAVGALGDALRAGFAKQGEVLLGGDATFARMHIRATDSERAVLQSLGRVSESATMRTMARTLDGSDQALAELKGVDAEYPLAGAAELADGSDFQAALAGRSAVADGMLLERLRVKVGDKIRIGEIEINVRGVLKSEPDAIADRLTYGPRLFVSLDTLEATGLVKPGTLVRWRYAVKRPVEAPSDREALKALRADVQARLPEAGFTALDRHDPNPQIARTLDRLRQFLILIGLASLMVGGVGIANAVATFIDKRVKVIATLRSVGATGGQVMGLFLTQILVMTGIGIALGLSLGILAPLVIDQLYGGVLPVRAEFSVSPRSIAVASLYGVLVAMLFALWPLGRAETVRASVLFRDQLQAATGRPRTAILVMTALVLAALLGLAVLTSEPRHIAAYVFGGLIVMLVVFSGLGILATRIARWAPRPRSPTLALALRNIGAPDGLTRSVILSLGAGLSLLVAVALANASLVEELKGRLPDSSPDYFLLDVPKGDYPGLADFVRTRIPGATMSEAAMLRGRLVKLKGAPVESLKAPPDAQWVLSGDRGLSYSTVVPEGSVVVKGEWWPADYQGPPLVSFEAELAEKLGVTVGDTVTVNVLGRNIDATISNLRDVKWESLAINFVMVFSPNTLAAAPHNLLATISLPPGVSGATEADLARELGKSYPLVSAIRVRDAIDQVNKVFSKIMIAVQAAGGITLIAGALVLAGALATAQRRRMLEAVILKTIGARRRQILAAHAAEYALLTALTALVAILLGSAMAWVAVTQIMDLEFVFSLNAVLQTLVVAGGLIAVFGVLGTWTVLRAPAVSTLRSE
ncbi:MAG: ABC transporter permease [Hyphomicrobium sp.]